MFNNKLMHVKNKILLGFILSIMFSLSGYSNPLVIYPPLLVSELYYDSTGAWELEIAKNTKEHLLSYNLDSIQLITKHDTAFLKSGMQLNKDSVLVLRKDSLQQSLSIDCDGDFIILKQHGHNYPEWSSQEVQDFSFGKTNSSLLAPDSNQSVIQISSLCYHDIVSRDKKYNNYLTKTNNPTIGSHPLSNGSHSGTLRGVVLDKDRDTVPHARFSFFGFDKNYYEGYYGGICYEKDWIDVTCDSTGILKMNDVIVHTYLMSVYVEDSVKVLDTVIHIEPDSVHFYKFVLPDYDILINQISEQISSKSPEIYTYPNPAQHLIHIQINHVETENKEMYIKIYNTRGEIVNIMPVRDNHIIWNRKNAQQVECPDGMYLLMLQENKRIVAETKIILF